MCAPCFVGQHSDISRRVNKYITRKRAALVLRNTRSTPFIPAETAAMTNHSTAGSWHASDDVVRLLHNETTTAAAAAAAAAESSAATATVTVASAAAASAHRSSRATVAAIIAGFAGGTDDDDDDAPTTGWPLPPAGYSDGDPLEFNQTADDADSAVEQVQLNLDTGSNFMLLLEDFGEYFYSGNNGTDAAAAVTASTAAADAAGMQPNETLLDYVVNCTLQQLENGTIACGPPEESEYFQHYHCTYVSI